LLMNCCRTALTHGGGCSRYGRGPPDRPSGKSLARRSKAASVGGLLRLKQSAHITKAILLELEANGFQIVKMGGIYQ
jgi:hypothetical protein